MNFERFEWPWDNHILLWAGLLGFHTLRSQDAFQIKLDEIKSLCLKGDLPQVYDNPAIWAEHKHQKLQRKRSENRPRGRSGWFCKVWNEPIGLAGKNQAVDCKKNSAYCDDWISSSDACFTSDFVLKACNCKK